MNEISKILEKVKHDKDFTNLIQSNFLEFVVANGIEIPKEILISEIKEYFNKHTYNPDSKGLNKARGAISNYYKEEGIVISKENIILTASTSESYTQIFSNFTKPGQEILFPNPCYPLFEYLAKYSNITPKFYKLDEDNGWKINLKDLEKSITKKTVGIVLISPNNPTGTISSQKEIKQIELIAKKHNLFIIFDEVFSEFRSEKDFPRPTMNNEVKIFILNGISKMIALPDLKLAWIAIPGSDNKIIDKLETSNDTYLNANYLTQSLIPTLLPYRKTIAKNINSILNINRNSLKILINKYPKFIKGNIGTGGIHSILKLNTSLDEEKLVLKFLSKKNLLVHPGYFYDIKSTNKSSHIVISFLNENRSFKKALELLAEIQTL